MQRILLFILFFVPTICLAQNATITQSAQRSIEAAQFHQNLIIIFLIISVFANKIIAIANFLLQTQPDIHPLQIPSIILSQKGNVSFKILNKHEDAATFAGISVIDEKDKIIQHKYSNLWGNANVTVPYKCSVIIEGFGYEKRIIKPGQISTQNQIILKPKNDISVDEQNLRSKSLARWILLFATILGIYLSATISSFYPPLITFLIIILTVANLIVIIRNSPRHLTVFDKKNNLYKDKKIIIKNAKGEKIKDIRTNKRGQVGLVATPAFYKATSPNSTSTAFRVESQNPVDLNLKLN